MPLYPERITPVAKNLNGFDPSAWEARSVVDKGLWGELISFWGGCTPVCHNPSFERAFIALTSRAAGFDDVGLDYHWIGTESLAWPLYLSGELPKLSLSRVLEYFGLEAETRPHRAMNGATACRDAYLKLINHHVRGTGG